MGGRRPSAGGCRPTQTCAAQSPGKSSMGMAWIARSPVAMALIASGRRARHSVADRRAAGERLGEQPLRVALHAVVDDAWRRMAGREPGEPHALAVEIDAGRCRVPLEEAVADPERQATEIVAPDELRLLVARERPCDSRQLQAAEGVLRSQVGEPGRGHGSFPVTTRLRPASRS